LREPLANTTFGHVNLTGRRTSLLAFGGAALAALAIQEPAAEARKNGARKSRKKSVRRCQKQGPACREFARQPCAHVFAPSPLRDACVNRGEGCCSAVETCEGGDYFACLLAHMRDLVPV
jgi:hypothetical protein